MVETVRKAALVAAMAFGISPPVQAATMNFDTLPDEGAQLSTYVENGITAKAIGGALAYWQTPGTAHLDDAGTGMASGIDFTMAGLFDAGGFSLISRGYGFTGAPGALPDNIFVTGFQGSTAVSTASFLLSAVAGTVQSFLLGPNFAGLTSLRIELRYPAGVTGCGAPCGHFDLDSVTLNAAPVPLPASGLLLAGAGVGLAGLRRRRIRAARG